MTKKQMLNELYKKYYEARFDLGYFAEESAAWTPERAERFENACEIIQAKLHILEELASTYHASPLFKEWYMDAFKAGHNADSLSDCVTPENLVDMA